MVELQMMTATATVSQDQNDDDGDEDTQQWRWYDDGAMTRTVSISQCDDEAVSEYYKTDDDKSDDDAEASPKIKDTGKWWNRW